MIISVLLPYDSSFELEELFGSSVPWSLYDELELEIWIGVGRVTDKRGDAFEYEKLSSS